MGLFTCRAANREYLRKPITEFDHSGDGANFSYEGILVKGRKIEKDFSFLFLDGLLVPDSERGREGDRGETGWVA